MTVDLLEAFAQAWKIVVKNSYRKNRPPLAAGQVAGGRA
jgi:hypothetical protein